MAYELERILGDEKAPEDVKALVGDYRARREGLSKLYTDKKQSKAQNEYVVSTELVANMLGDLLGNSYFVERMGARNDGAWKRFVLALKAAHDGKAAGISKEAQKYLSGLYKSYVKAVDAAGSGVKVSSITDKREKEKAADAEKGVDSEVDERYNKKRKYKQISNQEYAIISSRIMADNSNYMARDGDLPQYGVAPSNNYYYIYENFSPGHFGILKQIAITDANKGYINLIEKVIGGNNGKSVIGSASELDRVLQILKNQARNHRDNYAFDSEGRSNSKNGGISLGESERDRIRTSRGGDGDRGLSTDSSTSAENEKKEKAPEGTATNKSADMRYSLSKNAKTELHKALYDTSYRSEVKLRDVTPDIMISQKGVRNLPMAMNASHI
ncbi:MAG: hypothetical protein J6D16_02815 [Clostridia bacterium]|nr:hypothetical protein [Clostridia bacterium]